MHVPPAITETIAERVARLPSGCREVLGLAAVIGGDVNLPTLAAAADHDVASTLELIKAAVVAAMVEERGFGRFAFRHPLFRPAVYDQLGTALAANGHTAQARALLVRWDLEIRSMARDAEWLPAVVQLADVARLTGGHALARLGAPGVAALPRAVGGRRDRRGSARPGGAGDRGSR